MWGRSTFCLCFGFMVSTLAVAATAKRTHAVHTYHAVVIVVSSPPVRISNMFIKAFVNFSGSISSVSIATQISFRSLWGLRATTDDASEFRFECNESSTHTVDCEYLSGKLSRFHDKSKFQESSGGKCKSDGRLNWRKTTSPHRLTQKEQQRKTALFTRRPFYVWRFNGTFGAASQAHRSCDGIGPAAHAHMLTTWRQCRPTIFLITRDD